MTYIVTVETTWHYADNSYTPQVSIDHAGEWSFVSGEPPNATTWHGTVSDETYAALQQDSAVTIVSAVQV